jgi:hypothetical protein
VPATVDVPVATFKAPSREGKIHIGAYLHPDFKANAKRARAFPTSYKGTTVLTSPKDRTW